MEKTNNVYSQNGEDGVIQDIISRIDKSKLNKWCVEFGAWDGMHLSNTYNLIKNYEYKSVLIEGDPKRFEDLKKNIPQKDAYKICKFIKLNGKDSLDNILSSTPIPHDFDLLSIDIDGCDYHIFDSLQNYKPKIICIEFNPSIPNEVEYIQPRNFNLKHGSSARAIINLGKRKGYSLANITLCNIFLIRDDLIQSVIGNEEMTLEDIRNDSDAKVFLFTGYDGTILSNKKELAIAWHTGVPMSLKKIQYLPKFLRHYFYDYNIVQKCLFFLLVGFKNTNHLINFFKARLKK